MKAEKTVTATTVIQVNIEVATIKSLRGTLNETFKFTNSFNKQSIRVLSAVVSGKINTNQKIHIAMITSIAQSDRNSTEALRWGVNSSNEGGKRLTINNATATKGTA